MCRGWSFKKLLSISIHAPRTGSDTYDFDAGTNIWTISIHAPRTGSDVMEAMLLAVEHDFNPRSPHGERRHFRPLFQRRRHISIHAPRTGSDAQATYAQSMTIIFQSTLPARGATLIHVHTSKVTKGFQSTLPARGATAQNYNKLYAA